MVNWYADFNVQKSCRYWSGHKGGQETATFCQNVAPKSHLEAEKEQRGMELMQNLRDM